MNTGPSIRPAFPATLLCLALLWAGGALAQESVDPDPPGQVARLSLFEGDVVVVEAGQGESVAAVLNRPLTTGDELRVGRASRAELQLGNATLHLDAGSRLTVLELEDDTAYLRLTEGTIVANVREYEDQDDDQDDAPAAADELPPVVLETPNARVALLEPGEYRIAIEDGGVATVVGVREGASEISSGSEAFSLGDEQEGRYTGVAGLDEEVHPLDRRDRFESWADERVADDERSESSRYVSREIIGYRDLDTYGYWESDPFYGNVWSPRHFSYGWAPYRFGHWAWIGPWGWTWIDNAPWGFAPFHYGRWAFLSSRWCWVPGPRHVRPYYAPALVGWRGGGSNVAWYPLGPHDAYVPGRRVSDGYLRRVNPPEFRNNGTRQITHRRHDADPVKRYSNERNIAAFTAMPRGAFASGRPVSRNLVRVNDRDLTQSPSHHTSPPPPVMRDQRASVIRTSPTPYRPSMSTPRTSTPARNVPTQRYENDRRAEPTPRYQPVPRSEPTRRYETPSPQRSQSYPAPAPRSQSTPDPRPQPRPESRSYSRQDSTPSSRHNPRDRDRGNPR